MKGTITVARGVSSGISELVVGEPKTAAGRRVVMIPRPLLGDGGRVLHESLQRYNDGRNYRLHYVTAREMFNIARAAMDGKSGDPSAYYDYLVAPPPVADHAR